MARIENPFSLFEVDDDELDPVAILARAEAKKISETNAASEQDLQQPQAQQQLEKKDDAGGRAERGRGAGRGGRGRGVGRAGGESWGQYGEGYTRGYGGDYDGRGGRGGRVGRGGSGRGRGRGYYDYRGSGNGNGDQYGANRNHALDGGVASVDVEGGEVQEVQGRGYYGNRRGRNDNSMFEENHNSGWEPRVYGGEGRRYGGRGGRYERSENWNEPPRKEDGGEGKNQNDVNDADGGSARDVFGTVEVPKDSENEVPENAVEENINQETPAPEDVSEKKNAEDETMTLEEYEKLLFERRKALEALKTEGRKVDIDVDKSFGGMTLIEKKKEDDVFVKLKSDKDKLKKAALEKEERARKAMSINEFLKPVDGEAYIGPSYARERAARIRSERRAREDEERKHATGEEGAEAPASASYYGGGRGRGRGQRAAGYRGGGGEFSSDGERGRARGDQAGFRAGVTIPHAESNKEFLDEEFPVLGGAAKA